MAKQLSMGQIQSILTPHQSGCSNRRIAELLDVHRETVARYIAQSEGVPAKPDHRVAPGPASACAPFRATIISKLERGLSGQRIYQDLLDEEDGFTASYSSVRRFIASLRQPVYRSGISDCRCPGRVVVATPATAKPSVRSLWMSNRSSMDWQQSTAI